MTADQNGSNVGAGGYLSVDDIIRPRKMDEQDVLVPEWGGRVRIRALTVRENAQIGQEAAQMQKGPNADDPHILNGLYFIHSVVDPANGKPLFRLGHYDSLKGTSAAAMNRVIQAILRINGMGQEAAQEAAARFQDGPRALDEVPAGAAAAHDGGAAGG